MRRWNIRTAAALLVSAGLTLGSLKTANAIAVSASATLASPFAVDVNALSGDVFQEYAYAQALAGYGFGKIVAYTSTDWTLQPTDLAGVRSSTATAAASYADTLTIDSTVAPAGSLGVLWFDVLLTFDVEFDDSRAGSNVNNVGTVSFSTYWDAVVNGRMTTVGGYCNLFYGDVAGGTRADCGGLGDVTDASLVSYELRTTYGVPFIFGEPFSLGMRTQVTAQSSVGLQNADTRGRSTLDFDGGNSMYWDGVSRVTWNDQSVPYSIRSSSGTDYRGSFAPAPNQVPEPSSLLLLAGALALWRTAAAGRAGRGDGRPVRRGASAPAGVVPA